MKKNWLVILLATACLLSSCTSFRNPQEINAVPSREKETEIMEERLMQEIVSKTVAVNLTDVTENRFANHLEVQLTKEQTDEFLKALCSAQTKDAAFGDYPVYEITMLDGEGETLLTLCVDNASTIDDLHGTHFCRQGALDEILTTLEQEYLLKDGMYHRKPGSNYFGLMELAGRGRLIEITENDFIEGQERNLTKEDIQELAQSLKEASFSDDATEQMAEKYILTIYSAGGGLLYRFIRDPNGHIFTLEGYEIICDSLSEWLERRIAEIPNP